MPVVDERGRGRLVSVTRIRTWLGHASPEPCCVDLELRHLLVRNLVGFD